MFIIIFSGRVVGGQQNILRGFKVLDPTTVIKKWAKMSGK